MLGALPVLLSGVALAVEGMWEPSQLPGQAPLMRLMGYAGNPTTLADLEKAPLAAIVQLPGCTASFVSGEGLLVTNHHCAVDALLQVQAEGEDLVTTGFTAKDRKDERPAGAGMRAWITTELADVTAQVTGGLPAGLTDLDRHAAIETANKALVAECEKPGDRRCKVASYDGGLRYVLVTRKEFRDLRLVHAPPDMVGNFGDEIDNWHWPRHSGDWAFFRVYAAGGGKPAAYAKGNVPYKPKAFLKPNPAGIAPGKFVTVAGYPGGTDRWRTALDVERMASIEMPRQIEELNWLFDQATKAGQANPQAARVLAGTRASAGNSLFYQKGVLEAFRKGEVVRTLKLRDTNLDAWVAAKPERANLYQGPIAELRKRIVARDATRQRDTAFGWLGRSDYYGTAVTLYRWSKEREKKKDADRELGFQDRDKDLVRARLAELDAGTWLPLDREFIRRQLTALANLPESQRIPELDNWMGGRDARAVAAAVDRLFNGAKVTENKARMGLFGKPAAQLATADGFLRLAHLLHPYSEARRKEGKEDAGAYARLRPIFAAALKEFDPARSYSDANGTLRLTFGTVKGYSAGKDALEYLPQTTANGILEKSGEWPFKVPPDLERALKSKDWGPYADPRLGTLPIDFLSDLDITGGNSGSPTLDRDGRWVGLAFDGNMEGIASDWIFDKNRARTIHVDVRYLLWYLDKVAGADSLIIEMGLSPSLFSR